MGKLVAVLGMLAVATSLSAHMVPDEELIADDKPNLYDRQQIRASQPYNQGTYYYQGSAQSTQGSNFYWPPERGGYNPNYPAANPNTYNYNQGYGQ